MQEHKCYLTVKKHFILPAGKRMEMLIVLALSQMSQIMVPLTAAEKQWRFSERSGTDLARRGKGSCGRERERKMEERERRDRIKNISQLGQKEQQYT